jgi:hypothetical protein
MDIFKAELPDLQVWARGLMASRPPDFIVGADYLRRWWVVPRNDFCNVYLHEFRVSDDDRALHDHPWASTSVLLEGGYIEHTPEGAFHRHAGDVVSRDAEALHRVQLFQRRDGSSVPAISLFITGPKVREWGFACGQGWVHWSDFVDARDAGAVGAGCGEPDVPTRVTERGFLPLHMSAGDE